MPFYVDEYYFYGRMGSLDSFNAFCGMSYQSANVLMAT